MKKCLCLVGLWLVAVNAQAFGPGTHFYVSQRILGPGQEAAWFAAALPDCEGFASTSQIKSAMKSLTHHHWYHMPRTPFGIGFSLHNGDWGADYYAHNYYHPEIPPSFMALNMKEFSEISGCALGDAEALFEAMYDYVLRRDLGPAYGTIIYEAAVLANQAAYRDQFVRAYAEPLRERVPSLTRTAAETELAMMYNKFVLLMKLYGSQIGEGDLSVLKATCVDLLKGYMNVDDETALDYFDLMEGMCGNYAADFNGMIAEIESHSPYEMPVSSWTGIVLTAVGMMFGGWGAWLRRGWLGNESRTG